jgi:CheY-like chemotaxis protein
MRLMQATAASSKTHTFRRADGSPRRVLYAEDQTTSRIVTTAMLKHMGFEVDAVEDGELALHQARHEDYDVILLDIEMPVMDGVTAARSIRSELKHCDNTPIFALSAFLADSTEASVWRDAFDNAVPKPANSNELLKAMTKAMGLKDRNLAVLAANDQPTVVNVDNMIGALRKAITPGSWKRLQITAGHEMRQLALTMGAALEAKDWDVVHKCSANIKAMAKNFEATPVLDHLMTAPLGVVALLTIIDEWQSA